MIRNAIAKNLDRLIAQHTDALPPALVRRFNFPPLAKAWRDVHAPHDLEQIARARERIIFDEFFTIALAAAVKRARREAAGGARPLRARTASGTRSPPSSRSHQPPRSSA